MAGDTTITIIGNLVRDPEMKVTDSGAALVRFSVAATPRRFDKTSQTWVDSEPLFMSCSAWRDLAEHVAESLSKGDRVVVTGRLRQRQWEKDGQKHTSVELDVDEVGASVRFCNVVVRKADRGTGHAPTETPAGNDEPWLRRPADDGVPF